MELIEELELVDEGDVDWVNEFGVGCW